MWNTSAQQSATSVLSEGGSIFGELSEIQSIKLTAVETGKVFQLGRFEIILSTKERKEPFVSLELDGQVYSGYARGVCNQLINMAEAAAADPANGCHVTGRKVWTDLPVGMPVRFADRQSENGAYKIMEVGANADGEVTEGSKGQAAKQDPTPETTDAAPEKTAKQK